MKIKLLILLFITMFGSLGVMAVDPVYVHYDFKVGDIYYKIISTSPAQVEVVTGSPTFNSYSGDIYVPWHIGYNSVDYDVVAIGENAFRDCDALTSVHVGTYVSTIKTRAFYNCTALKTVTLDSYVYTIGTLAFAYCKNLETVNMGGYTHDVGKSSFAFCTSLKNVNFGTYTYRIHDDAFRMCTSLEHINITGTYMNYIGPYAFAECYNLREFQCNTWMQNICKDAFFLCKSMRWVNVDPQNANCAVHKFAFEQCKLLTNTYFGEKVYSFGNGAFMQCTSLQSGSFYAKHLTFQNRSLIFYGCFGLGWTGLFF